MKIPRTAVPVYHDPAEAVRAWPHLDSAIGIGPFYAPVTTVQAQAIADFIAAALDLLATQDLALVHIENDVLVYAAVIPHQRAA